VYVASVTTIVTYTLFFQFFNDARQAEYLNLW